ncbi:MAG TPA: DUF1318 domain-containing protein [Bacteroidia bacterium]|nr:DUF1318 domain-containing protein [Bacteroidia bacterium]
MTLLRHPLSTLAFALALPLGLASCLKPFDVNVATPEPIKVDLSMDVHVYQHGVATDPKKAEASADFRSAMDRRRNRMSEIQELKNNRLVGEGRSGLLSIRNRPAGDYGDYVETTVDAENADRELLMRHESEEKSLPLDAVRREQWRHWQRKSFPGEWIEVGGEDGAPYRWEQKRAAGE